MKTTRSFFVLALLLCAPLSASASSVYYVEVLRSDYAAFANPDTRTVFESETPIADVWNLPGGAVSTPSGLGSGWLTYPPGGLFPKLSYEHALEPLDPATVVQDIVSASISIYAEDNLHRFNVALVKFTGGAGTAAAAGVQVEPFVTFSMFGGSVLGAISLADGTIAVDAYGLKPFRIIASVLKAEYVAAGAVSSGGIGTQPSIPEPSAAAVFPLGILLGGLAALRVRSRAAATA